MMVSHSDQIKCAIQKNVLEYMQQSHEATKFISKQFKSIQFHLHRSPFRSKELYVFTRTRSETEKCSEWIGSDKIFISVMCSCVIYLKQSKWSKRIWQKTKFHEKFRNPTPNLYVSAVLIPFRRKRRCQHNTNTTRMNMRGFDIYGYIQIAKKKKKKKIIVYSSL